MNVHRENNLNTVKDRIIKELKYYNLKELSKNNQINEIVAKIFLEIIKEHDSNLSVPLIQYLKNTSRSLKLIQNTMIPGTKSYELLEILKNSVTTDIQTLQGE